MRYTPTISMRVIQIASEKVPFEQHCANESPAPCSGRQISSFGFGISGFAGLPSHPSDPSHLSHLSHPSVPSVLCVLAPLRIIPRKNLTAELTGQILQKSFCYNDLHRWTRFPNDRSTISRDMSRPDGARQRT